MIGRRGGSNPGERRGGRQKGTKNRATIERELLAAAAVTKTESRELAKDVLARLMRLAEDIAGLYQPPNPKELQSASEEVAKGDWTLFGEWFDRTVTCAKELAKYQSPQIKSVDAPAPPPDPKDLERKSRKRFGLRVFEGGKPLLPPSEAA